ncbi:hypothetical protein M3P21_14360 [Ruegeria sp. 2012CJ41-6]|uniref:Uncharacterized protein n=1 Tax=Ruegeria spongiae TaxID=2942209 RepID=A0ABT0Q4C4_9RHOB|nr:hypothetical protein [Ruegeria spongiae]MCL6284716.1 hypothetical protein [Ruegeria spongiae]
MKFNNRFGMAFVLSGLVISGAVNAAPTGQQICKKMISDGRGGGMSQSDCMCSYRVADAVLDDDVKALLFDSWYNGTNNMDAIEKLPRRNRIKKQFRPWSGLSRKTALGRLKVDWA